jgi:ADP-heptose:LPS heptosyltransferase
MSFPQFISPLNPENLPIQRCPVSRKHATQRILIMRLGSQGDIVMGTPLLAALRQAYPNAYLTWMVEYSSREAIDANPFIDELIIWDGGFWKELLSERWKNMLNREQWLGLTWLRAALKFRHKIRRRSYDVFINFHGEQWPTLARFIGASIRIGVFGIFPRFDESVLKYRSLYTTSYLVEGFRQHHTEIQLLPLKALGLPEPTDKQIFLGYSAEDAASVDVFLRECGITERFIVIAPLTTWVSRNWPEERFAQLGDRLAQETGCRVVMIGSPKERSVVEQIAARMETNPVRAAGIFGFRGMAALIARASVLVTGDTGPMHAAAAVGTPYIALFGPTPVRGRAPLVGAGLSLMHPVPCGPCDRPLCSNIGEDHMLCMRLITVEEVTGAVVGQLASNPQDDIL